MMAGDPNRGYNRNRQTDADGDRLVLEIVPGQAASGIRRLYEPHEYKGQDIGDLVDQHLEGGVSAEDQPTLRSIEEQLDSGHLVHDGDRVNRRASPNRYWRDEETLDGEDFKYIKLKAITPQEGGLR